MTALAANPYVFIVGCPRSGTTLLRRMVDAHGDIAVLDPETHWIPRYYRRRWGVSAEGMVLPEILPLLFADQRFLRLAIPAPDVEALLPRGEGTLAYSAFVSAIFDLYGAARNKRLVGDKTPAYVRHMATLHGLWPQARFVHIIRDGRDVCLSLLGWPKTAAGKAAARFSTWADDPVSTSALFWEWMIRSGRGDAAILGRELYAEIRYESLVGDPARAGAELCAFLGLPYDETMLAFHQGRTRSEPGLDAKHAWLPVTAGLRDWRASMSTDDVERFEAVAGDLLDELGYPRALPSPSAGALEHAGRLRERFATQVAGDTAATVSGAEPRRAR